jgi:hypothetical protein
MCSSRSLVFPSPNQSLRTLSAPAGIILTSRTDRRAVRSGNQNGLGAVSLKCRSARLTPGSTSRRRASPSSGSRCCANDGFQVHGRAGLDLDKRLRLLHAPSLRDARDRRFYRLLVVSFHSHDRVEGPEDQVHLGDRRKVANLEKSGAVGIAVDSHKDERSLLD